MIVIVRRSKGLAWQGGWGRNAHYPLWLTAGSLLWLSGLTREDVIEHPLRVLLLIGKTYDVEGGQPFDVVAKSDERIEVTGIGANQCEIVWPVEFAVAEGRAPGGRPLLGATWNNGGKSFYVMPNPSWLRGAVTWTDNYCCDVWGDGTNFTYACDNTCTCEGCTVYGNYRYEGYALPVWGIPCGCLYVVDVGPAEIVRFEFDRAAAIYEDPYTNMPGVVVNPSPSNSTLCCVVRGGTYGGRLTVSLNDAGNAKIRCVSGDNLPDNELIEPNTMRSFEFEYMPIAPSASANDIIASALFVEEFVDVPHAEVATLTSVRVELTPAHIAISNPSPHRHVFGVDEFVRTAFYPSDVSGAWIDEVDVDVNADDVSFWCPWNAGLFHPTVSAAGASYQTEIEIIEPIVVCRDASWNGIVGTNGVAGNVCMNLSLYVEPDYVSFEGLSLEEIPVEGEGIHFGYFDDQIKGGSWTHTTQAGAGRWWTVDQLGFWANDEAKVNEYIPPWCEGWKRWLIPMGWGNVGILKGRIDPNPTTQDFFITSSGTVTIQKFGHTIMRSINNEVFFFDGIQVH